VGFDLTPAYISLKVTITATAIIFFLGLLIAWWMTNYNGRFKLAIDGVLTLPLVLPPTVAGFILLVLIGKNGPVGQFMSLFGVNIIFSWYAAVIASVFVAFPLMYRTVMGAFEQIDHNTLSAARTLGASEWTVFWKIAVPAARPGIAAATALTFARCLGEFGATLMVAGNIPGKTTTIPLAIYFATQSNNMEVAVIWVAIIMVISLTVLIVMNYWEAYQKKLRKGASD
jgi:molybdate transport system permease protein